MILRQLTAVSCGVLLCFNLCVAQEKAIRTNRFSAVNVDDSLAQVAKITQKRLDLFQMPIETQLDSMACEVELSYNRSVKSYIDTYSGPRYRNHVGRMLGLSQYYFPLYEQVFQEVKLPDEIKYLSVIESALNPHAISRVGATGPWQFMYATAKSLGLQMNNYVDERKDPIAASYAAATYLKDAYSEFGDWQLAIASYNCGKGNVYRAIKRSGIDHPSFWDIIAYLPKETRNYVPAYIAMVYVMKNADIMGIVPIPPDFEITMASVVSIDKLISMKALANALNISEKTLANLNPSYKKLLINGSITAPKKLIIPGADKSAYANLYAVLHDIPQKDIMQIIPASSNASKPITHIVKKGESIQSIALIYAVEPQDIKVWNSLKTNTIVPKQQLKIQEPRAETEINTISVKAPNTSPKKKSITYTVKKGDSLERIASKYTGISINSLRSKNNIKGNTIHPGMVITIR